MSWKRFKIVKKITFTVIVDAYSESEADDLADEYIDKDISAWEDYRTLEHISELPRDDMEAAKADMEEKL